MQIRQSIDVPCGVNVFGSRLIRVDPDYATLHFGVTREAAWPEQAMQQVRDGTRDVRRFLRFHCFLPRDRLFGEQVRVDITGDAG